MHYPVKRVLNVADFLFYFLPFGKCPFYSDINHLFFHIFLFLDLYYLIYLDIYLGPCELHDFWIYSNLAICIYMQHFFFFTNLSFVFKILFHVSNLLTYIVISQSCISFPNKQFYNTRWFSCLVKYFLLWAVTRFSCYWY